MRHIAMTTSALALAATSGWAQDADTFDYGAMNAVDATPAFEEQFRAPYTESGVTLATERLAEGLVHPWAIELLPNDAGLLVTERSGALRHVSMDGTVSEPISGLPEVENRAPEGGNAQAGLLDVKVGPNFAEDRMIYITYAKPVENDMSVTAAARGVLSDDMTALTDVEEIFVQEPPSPTRMHYGSRIVFDDAGHLFITTGDHFTVEERQLAQTLDNTYGKVIRLNLDGSVPEDNPFVGQEGAIESIWSYGHRNVQSAVVVNGDLWTVEHGPAGGDELNKPEAGKNYGWPVISYGVNYEGSPVGTGQQAQEGMEQPVYYWDPVIAPGDVTAYTGEAFPEWEGDLLIGGLVAGGIVRLGLEGDLVSEEERLLYELGRVRDIEVLDDGTLLLATDYENGEIIHVTPGESDS